MADPPPDGLAAFGMTRDELPDGVDGLTGLASAAGLEPVSVELVSTDEWDAYEAAYADGIEAWAAAAPDDPDRDAFLARSRSFHDELRGLAPRVDGVRDRPLPARLRAAVAPRATRVRR